MVDASMWLSDRFPEVAPHEFYRELFPEGSFERAGVFEDGKYNGIVVEIEDSGRVLRHTVTDDLRKIAEVIQGDDFCLMAPISYIGKSRRSENAREMFAMAIDLDGIEDESNLWVLMNQVNKGDELRDAGVYWGLPRPTYVVSSGTGLHLYYAFKTPPRLFPSAAKELAKLKKRLTWQAWTQGASTLSENIQYESLTQAFRMVGSITKVGTRVRAFRTGEKVTVGYLNGFVPDEHRAESLGYESRLSLDEARSRYPEWYEKRIVEGRPRGTWTCKRDLYDWWIRKVRAKASVGHRYWCLMTLAVYAKKCAIPYEELVRDAIGLVPLLDGLGHGKAERFTEDDAMDACEAYNDSYMTYPRRVIEERTDISIPANKRNGRTLEQNIKRVNAMCDFDVAMGEPERRGRPKGSGTKRDEIRAYAAANPEASQREVARALGVSKTTVNKWLKQGGI